MPRGSGSSRRPRTEAERRGGLPARDRPGRRRGTDAPRPEGSASSPGLDEPAGREEASVPTLGNRRDWIPPARDLKVLKGGGRGPGAPMQYSQLSGHASHYVRLGSAPSTVAVSLLLRVGFTATRDPFAMDVFLNDRVALPSSFDHSDSRYATTESFSSRVRPLVSEVD
jgi:hypothetical protein